jgi:heme oxygenase
MGDGAGTDLFSPARNPARPRALDIELGAPLRRAQGRLGWGIDIDFHGMLRASTRADHEQVDALFGSFDLGAAPSYGMMLRAHARALLPAEDWMANGAVPLWEPRGAALKADLDALGLAVPDAEPLHWPADDAAYWGTAYVLEGSRLGGAMIARGLAADMPRAYLGQVHAPGHWRAFLGALDERAGTNGAMWRADAVAAAQRAFETFALAARCESSR